MGSRIQCPGAGESLALDSDNDRKKSLPIIINSFIEIIILVHPPVPGHGERL